MNRKQLINAMAIVLATSGLVACGGGGDDTTTSLTSSKATVGTITAFGSVYVNGIKFDTSNTSYDVDDDNSTTDQSDLAVGMKVRVDGSVNDDRVTGTATSIQYDDDVEGPIDANGMVTAATTKSFTVLGMSVLVDANTTVFDDTTFDDLAKGNIVEVSGYFDGKQIVATRIELQDSLDDEFEVKGTIDSYDGITIDLILQNDVPVSYPVNLREVPEVDPIPGQFVEVKLTDPGTGLEAIEIELDDEDYLDDNDEDVSVQGVITDEGGVLMVNGVPFDVNDGTEYDPTSLEGNLVAGMEVEVEGVMVNGVLIAEEIEAEAESEIEIEAKVAEAVATDADGIVGTLTLTLYSGSTLTVKTDTSTLFEDNSTSDTDSTFTLNDLIINSDFVEVEAYLNDVSELVASKIKREDSSDATSLEGPVESFDTTFIKIQGITYTLDPVETTFQVDGTTTNSSTFITGLIDGDTVEIKDNEPVNGVADEVKRETSD